MTFSIILYPHTNRTLSQPHSHTLLQSVKTKKTRVDFPIFFLPLCALESMFSKMQKWYVVGGLDRWVCKCSTNFSLYGSSGKIVLYQSNNNSHSRNAWVFGWSYFTIINICTDEIISCFASHIGTRIVVRSQSCVNCIFANHTISHTKSPDYDNTHLSNL